MYLFVIGQAGTAEFVAPLLQSWSETGRAFCVLADEPAVAMLHDMNLPCQTWGADGVTTDRLDQACAQPNAVVVSLSYKSSERTALNWARRRGIASAGILDNWYDLAERLGLKDENEILPDRVALIDDYAVSIAREAGADMPLTPVGYPPFSDLQALKPADESRVLFIDQPISRYPHLSPGYDEHDAWNLLCEAVPTDRIGFSPHPESAMAPPPQVHIEPNANAALETYGTVAGMYSTVLLGAFLQGRRTLSLQPGTPREDKFILTQRGFLRPIFDAEDLRSALSSPVPDAAVFAEALCGGCDRLEVFLESLSVS